MEVVEVIRLADWFVQNTVEVEPSYAALVNVLQNNAGQPTQQPVKEPLIALSELLGKMPTQELSALQMQVLETLFVSDIVGNRGKHWLNKQVRSTVYDPATTFQTIQQAAQRLTEAKRKLVEFKSAALAIGIKSQRDLDAHSPYLINVIFQGDAAINNVSDWKKTATDWEMIISGVAGIVGEKPEEVKVVGTSNGSIIFVLSASAIFTKVLATISKHISAIANDYLDFQLKREVLERSRMMTAVIRDDLVRQESERRVAGIEGIIDAVNKLVPNSKPEMISKLKMAVEKQIAFSEHGGEVDFVTPITVDVAADDYDAGLADTMAEVRQLIEDVRAEQQKTKLLTFKDDSAGNDD